MRICPSCGVEVSDHARFCRRCGAKLTEQRQTDSQDHPAEAPETEGAAGAEDIAMDAGANASAENPRAKSEHTEDSHAEKAFEGEDYSWGPPTGGEDYDEQAMPAVLVTNPETAEEEPPRAEPRQPYTYRLEAPGWDHTDSFEEEDIARNKPVAMAAYVLGPLGVIIAMLAGKDSPYADFHMRQGLRITVTEGVIGLLALLLCWTVIVPAAAAVCWIILAVLRIMGFVSVSRGRATELPMIRSLGFLK